MIKAHDIIAHTLKNTPSFLLSIVVTLTSFMYNVTTKVLLSIYNKIKAIYILCLSSMYRIIKTDTFLRVLIAVLVGSAYLGLVFFAVADYEKSGILWFFSLFSLTMLVVQIDNRRRFDGNNS